MPDVSLEEFIRLEADKIGVPAELALAIAQQESSMNPRTPPGPPLPSGQRAVGIMQLLPSTAKSRGINADDPIQNIRGGLGYLRELLDKHKDLNKAVAEYGGVVTDTTYVPAVLARMRSFAGNQAPSRNVQGTTPPPAPRWHPPMTQPWHPPMTDTSAPPEPRSLMGDIASGFDPRTRTGRRNWMGMGGSVAAGAALGAASGAPVGGIGAIPGAVAGGVTGGIRGALTVAGGAALGGALAETGEQAYEALTTGAPPRPGEIATAAGEQGLYEVGGQTLMWPIKAIGRRAVASRVGRFASERLGQMKSDVLEKLSQGMDAARGMADAAKARLAGTPQVSRSTIGNLTKETLRGPVKTAKDFVGQTVEDAAETGPEIAAQPLRDRLAELSQQITPQVQTTPQMMVGGTPLPAATAQAIAARNPGVLAALPENHPLPATLDYLRNTIGDAETIPFAEAHKMKRILDNAVNWDRSAKKIAEQITKGFRQTLREGMTGHAPYDEATAAYRAVSKLHQGEYVKAFLKTADTDPEKITRLIHGNQPTNLQMLKDLLLVEAPKGGGAQAGQAAWDGIRAAWTQENLIKKGIEKMDANLSALDPEFVDIMYGDQVGKTILGNLQQLSGAYRTALAKVEALSAQEATEKSTKGAISTAERALKKSSLNKAQDLEQEVADVAVSAVAPVGFWKAKAIGRLLKGPKMQDLVTWAALSPRGTQMLVKAFTSPTMGMVAADVLRLFDLAGIGRDLVPEDQSGGPPQPTDINVTIRRGPPPAPSAR